MEALPVIQGYIKGFGAGGSVYAPTSIAVTMTFCVTIEYVPKPSLYQMVERKPPIINSNELSSAENLAAVTSPGVTAET